MTFSAGLKPRGYNEKGAPVGAKDYSPPQVARTTGTKSRFPQIMMRPARHPFRRRFCRLCARLYRQRSLGHNGMRRSPE
jgi:hypothetical protein